MSNYGKLENGNFRAYKFIELATDIIYTQDPQEWYYHGYKLLIETPKPEPIYGYYWDLSLEEQGENEVLVVWTSKSVYLQYERTV